MASPVVVDGLLSFEKVNELLALQAEHAELDFKGTVNLRDGKHRLGLVKDMIAMMNTPTGGYLLIGVHDDGTLAHDLDPINASEFDSADLAQLVSRYVTTPPTITSKAHSIDGRALVLIHVSTTFNGLPAFVSSIGQYDEGGGNMKTVFREGVLYIREGTRTVAATDSHWPVLLETYRKAILADAREGVDALIRRVVIGMDEHGIVSVPPLDLDMNDDGFRRAVEQSVGTEDGDRRLKQFIRRARRAISEIASVEVQEKAMTKVASVAIAALAVESRTIFTVAITALHDAYMDALGASSADGPPRAKAVYWLRIVLRVLCVGAAAVREKAWWAVEPLVNLRVDDYYLVWIRHGLTVASRANLLAGSGRSGATLLSQARELMLQYPSLRDDVAVSNEQNDDEEGLPIADAMLQSLCQFDFLWCVVAIASNSTVNYGSLFYPSCAGFDQRRTEPAIDRLAQSASMRIELLPGVDDSSIAEAIAKVLELAISESHHGGGSGWWRSNIAPDVVQFLAANPGLGVE